MEAFTKYALGYRDEIVARLDLEGARDVSDEELQRCFKDCAAPEKLMKLSRNLRERGLLFLETGASEFASGVTA